MSKLVIYLLVILNFYCFCERIFTQTDLEAKNNELDVKLGEEFALQFKSNPTHGSHWTFLNEDKVRDSIQFLRSKYVEYPINSKFLIIRILKKGGYDYFYFKAKKVTNEAQTLIFVYRGFLEKPAKKRIYILKVNVN